MLKMLCSKLKMNKFYMDMSQVLQESGCRAMQVLRLDYGDGEREILILTLIHLESLEAKDEHKYILKCSYFRDRK